MSVKIMTWVWDNSPYEGKALLIHLAMADHANDDGMCFPSQEGLAKKSRSSVRYVRDVVNDMVVQGLVELVKESNGRQNHLYRLVPKFRGNSVPAELGDTSPELDDKITGTLPPKNHHEPSLEPSVEKYECIYCHTYQRVGKKHYCSAMRQDF